MPYYISLLYKVISNYDQISGVFLKNGKLPALPRQLVILIVPLAGAQYRIAVFNLLAVDQAAKGVIGTQIGDCTARSFAFASLRAVV